MYIFGFCFEAARKTRFMSKKDCHVCDVRFYEVPPTDHSLGLCGNCGPFMRAGACEHVYASFLHYGIIDPTSPAQKDPSRFSRRARRKQQQKLKAERRAVTPSKRPSRQSAGATCSSDVPSPSAATPVSWAKDMAREQAKWDFFDTQRQRRAARPNPR